MFKLFTLVVSSSLPDNHGIDPEFGSTYRYVKRRLRASTISYACLCLAVPLGVAAALVQASIYDVPGGYRAVMFDRFSGVKDKARRSLNGLY